MVNTRNQLVYVQHPTKSMAQQKNGMILGSKGVQYGLQLPAGAPSNKRSGPAKVAAHVRPNIFGVDSDDEETVGSQLARQADKKRAAVKVDT